MLTVVGMASLVTIEVKRKAAAEAVENECEATRERIEKVVIAGISTSHKRSGEHWIPSLSPNTTNMFRVAIDQIGHLEALRHSQGHELDPNIERARSQMKNVIRDQNFIQEHESPMLDDATTQKLGDFMMNLTFLAEDFYQPAPFPDFSRGEF